MSEGENTPLEFAPPPRRAGKLTQAARKDSLKQARTWLLVVGGLTVAFQGFMFAQAEQEVRGVLAKQVADLQRQGMVIDQVKLEELTQSATRTTRLFYAGFMVLGVVFIGLGLAIYKAPLPVSVTALVLYLGSQGIVAMLDPKMLVQGFLIKIFIIAALVSAVRAAFAAERDRKAAALLEPAA